MTSKKKRLKKRKRQKQIQKLLKKQGYTKFNKISKKNSKKKNKNKRPNSKKSLKLHNKNNLSIKQKVNKSESKKLKRTFIEYISDQVLKITNFIKKWNKNISFFLKKMYRKIILLKQNIFSKFS